MLSRVPGCHFMLGARPPDQLEGEPHHSLRFRIAETPIETGISLLSKLAATIA
jgi:metal-dependent amidase/aminoacylase/carboxypeptidase family protein